MFHGWDGFYLMIGSASAGLIGLLFVVATLTSGRDPVTAARGNRLYLSPTVFHFAVVLVISAMAAAPLSAPTAAMIVAACALAGVAASAVITPQLRNGASAEAPHWSDLWCYGVAPGLLYLGLGAAAAMAIWSSPQRAAYGVGFVLLALLLLAIRNAWDLVTYLAPRAGG